MNLNEFGLVPEMGGRPGIPARIVAQHKERYELVCQYGHAFARLKTKEYYAGTELFPTVGDYVALQYIENGDSQIVNGVLECKNGLFLPQNDPFCVVK